MVALKMYFSFRSRLIDSIFHCTIAVVVLLMAGSENVPRQDDLWWHDVHTNAYAKPSLGGKVIRGHLDGSDDS
jgi:hypothetical protein